MNDKIQAQLTITIDVESDCGQGWQRPLPLTFENVLRGIPEILHPLFCEYSAKPTYLVSAEVLENERCVKILSSLEGKYELGTHLHGEFLEPHKTFRPSENGYFRSSDFPGSYPKEIELGKLSNLTELFKSSFGKAPHSYRAGRFGLGENTISHLESLGYLIDTSVVPFASWAHVGGPDFKVTPKQPYFVNHDNFLKSGNSHLLEVPVTVCAPMMYLGKHLSRVPILRRLGTPVWFRPTYSSVRKMKKVIDYYLQSYPNGTVLNMMFHSMEVIPGASPYYKTEKGCEAFLRRIESIISYCQSLGIQFATLKEIYDTFHSKYWGK